MKWSYRVTRIAGIDIRVHSTFLLIVIFFGLSWSVVHGLAGFGFGVALVLALFACVVLHELGHSLVAQRFNIPVREIILLPLGGVALLRRNPTEPMHELLIAVAGPAVNVVLALVLALVVVLTGDLSMLGAGAMVQGAAAPLSLTTFLTWLLEANIILVLFNMLPAFPLDGGRMLRAVLAMFMGLRRATRLAGRIGQVLALALGFYALLTFQFFLALIAVFIYLGASQEQLFEETNAVLDTQRVGDAYNKHALTLEIGDRVSKVVDYILTSYQPDFAVLQGRRLLGVVTRDDVLRALSSTSTESTTNVLDSYVTMIMQREIVRVDADVSLAEAQRTMNEQSVRLVAVYEDERYLGLVNMEDIAEAFTVLSYRERYFRQNPPPEAARTDEDGEAGEAAAPTRKLHDEQEPDTG
jgi:Zn-dependent protease